MSRILRVAVFLMLALSVVGGLVLAGCSSGQSALKMPDITLAGYSQGTSVDFNDATINSISEAGGEMGYKFGLAATLYPTYHYSTAARNAMAVALFGSPYKIGDGVSPTTYSQLTAGDQLAVDGAIFATLTAQEQNAVATAIAGFFDRVDTDMAAAKAPAETSAYALLKSSVGQSAADAWVADVLAGKNYADRFFVQLVKQYVVSMPAFFTSFYVALYGSVPATPTEDQIEAVAKLAGKTSFVNGTAGTMYPTQRDEQAQVMYGKAYKDLNQLAGEPQLVDAAVYQNLPSVFGAGAGADAVRAATRDAVATGMKLAGYITADNYTAANEMEKAIVDQALFATALPGPSQERDYIDFAAVPGAVLGWGAEMAPPLPLQGNIAYLTLMSKVTVTAANHWVQDVQAGTHPRQAFYRWLSKETVSQSASMGTLIQLGLAEFTLMITNSNDYEISVDSLNIVSQVPSSALGTETMVDAARQVVPEKIWVPANGEASIRVVAPVKTMDVITWAVLAGKPTADAQKLGGDVWAQFTAGTAEWTVVVEAKVSNDKETKIETYTLQ